MELDEVLRHLRIRAGAGRLETYVPMQESQLALIADFIEAQASKLQQSSKDLDTLHAVIDRLEAAEKAANEAWHEQEDELQSLRSKLVSFAARADGVEP